MSNRNDFDFDDDPFANDDDGFGNFDEGFDNGDLDNFDTLDNNVDDDFLADEDSSDRGGGVSRPFVILAVVLILAFLGTLIFIVLRAVGGGDNGPFQLTSTAVAQINATRIANITETAAQSIIFADETATAAAQPTDTPTLTPSPSPTPTETTDPAALTATAAGGIGGGDIDADGIPNSTDEDVDGDGLPNGQDDDVDADGLPNSSDEDIDSDNSLNGEDDDTDGDGLPNGVDDDVDGDGIPNATDDDVDGDGSLNGGDPDVDGDGTPNGDDDDVDGDGSPNAADDDIDGDGASNATDDDADGDGILNAEDTDGGGTDQDDVAGTQTAIAGGPIPTTGDISADDVLQTATSLAQTLSAGTPGTGQAPLPTAVGGTPSGFATPRVGGQGTLPETGLFDGIATGEGIGTVALMAFGLVGLIVFSRRLRK